MSKIDPTGKLRRRVVEARRLQYNGIQLAPDDLEDDGLLDPSALFRSTARRRADNMGPIDD